MKANAKKIRKHRKFIEEFKKEIVQNFETGKYSVCELEKLYGISNVSIYNWIYKYSKYNKQGYRVVEQSESSNKKVKELTDKIKDLESVIGQKQIKIDFLEKMIDVAKEELEIDIKKNFSTPPSNGSDQTKKA